jgi:hypothetical protein
MMDFMIEAFQSDAACSFFSAFYRNLTSASL